MQTLLKLMHVIVLYNVVFYIMANHLQKIENVHATKVYLLMIATEAKKMTTMYHPG